MTDQEQPGSGNRWEPPVPLAPPAEDHAPPAATPAQDPRASGRFGALRGSLSGTRGALAGAAAGLVLVSGLGGFAIGHAVAGDDVEQVGLVGEQGYLRDAPGMPGGPGFRGDRDGHDHDWDDDTDEGSDT